MSDLTNKGAKSAERKKENPYPFLKMSQPVLTGYILEIIVLLPMMMNETKYGAITKFKLNTFTTFFWLTAILLLLAFILYSATKETPERIIKKEDVVKPPYFADIALAIYWVLMAISTVAAFDSKLAFSGMTPRNNGFLIQTMYIASYFFLSHGLFPRHRHSQIFVWGGALFGAACIIHFFGIDLYKIGAVNGADYAGPFWNDTKYRFLGPMGNVNLGSYVLAITAIIAAGMYIQGIKPKWDRFNILTAFCYAVILFAELNINTDAGLVALAVAVLLIPPVLCRSLEHLCRMLHIFAVSAAVLTVNELVIEIMLRGEEFGTKAKLLVLGTAFLTLLSCALTLCRNKLMRTFLGRMSSRMYRGICAALIIIAVAAGICGALYITKPDPIPAGSVAGAIEIIDTHESWEKSKSVLQELGQILRGNFDDDFGHNRLFTWKRSLRLVELRPLFGIGPDNFKMVFAYYFSEEAKDQFPASSGGVDKAHNEFLDVLVDNGILGFIAYIAFFGLLLYYAFRRADKKLYSPVFGIAIAGYMAHAFFGYQLPIQSPCMWVMIGFAGAVIRSEERKNSDKQDVTPIV